MILHIKKQEIGKYKEDVQITEKELNESIK